MKLSIVVLAGALGLGALGCGKSYDVRPAPGFVKLEAEQKPYDWRATVAPDWPWLRTPCAWCPSRTARTCRSGRTR